MDELYEAYCIQRRLCDGASKMKQAFAMSPASKAARESLTEINWSYKEYTEVCLHPFGLSFSLFKGHENLAAHFSDNHIQIKGLHVKPLKENCCFLVNACYLTKMGDINPKSSLK